MLKKILKGLKEKGPKPVSSAKSSVPNGKAYPQSKPSVKTKSKKATEVQLGKGKRVDVQEGIMASNLILMILMCTTSLHTFEYSILALEYVTPSGPSPNKALQHTHPPISGHPGDF